jgi:hypothetical protein
VRLIYITGFTRSGTTYALDLLRGQQGCTGGREEQGLDFYWYLHTLYPTHESIAEEFARGERTGLRMGGFYAAHAMASQGPAAFLDSMALAGNDSRARNLVSKRPSEFWPTGWPLEYAERSKVFSDFRMIVMRRDFWSMMHSRHNHFPHLAGEDVFPVMHRYHKYYEDVPSDPRIKIFQYELFGEAIASGELADFLDLSPIRVDEIFINQNGKYEEWPS